MSRIIGVPADGNELTHNISPHFGHCNYFIGIEIGDNNEFKKVFALTNEGHGGCMEPVMNMKHRDVTDMILTGIGRRPYLGFQQVEISLYQGINGSIEENIEMFIQGNLKILSDASCGAHPENAHCQ